MTFLCWKILSSCPVYSINCDRSLTDIHQHTTRSALVIDCAQNLQETQTINLFVPHVRTSKYGQKSIKVVGPKKWNNIFKKSLKICFISHYNQVNWIPPSLPFSLSLNQKQNIKKFHYTISLIVFSLYSMLEWINDISSCMALLFCCCLCCSYSYDDCILYLYMMLSREKRRNYFFCVYSPKPNFPRIICVRVQVPNVKSNSIFIA